MRISWCTPAGRRAGDRPGHPHHRPVQPVGPVGGVERAAAHGRLDDHGAAGERGDQPVAGQEPDPRAARSPAAPRRPPRRRRRGGRSASRAPPGRPGRRRRPAPRPSCRRAASAPRCAAWSMPNAAPETTRAAGRGQRPRPMSAATLVAVGRGRAGADDRDRMPASRVEPQRALAPTARAGRRRARAAARRRSRSSSCAGHSSSPGTTKRMPRRSAPVELALRVARRRAVPPTSVEHAPTVRRLVRSWRSTVSAPSSVTSVGQPRVAGLGEPAQRGPRQPLVVDRGVIPARPAHGRAEQQRVAGAQPQGGVDLVDAGCDVARRPHTDAGRRRSRRAGAPGPRRAGSAGRRTPRRRARCASSVQRPVLPQRRARAPGR